MSDHQQQQQQQRQQNDVSVSTSSSDAVKNSSSHLITTSLSRKRQRSEQDDDLTPGDTNSERTCQKDVQTTREGQVEHDTKLPSELEGVDFTRRVAWGKYSPYPNPDWVDNTAIDDHENDVDDSGIRSHENEAQETKKGPFVTAPPLPLIAPDTPPTFTPSSPALCHHVNAISGRARACTIHLKHGPVRTPVFMPVGTKGSIKGLTVQEITDGYPPRLDHDIILANTYHLALQPGTELIGEMNGLHGFMSWNRNILTDSGGFQMVSLLKLATITEEGVTFQSPFRRRRQQQQQQQHDDNLMLLRPEDSIRHQNNIGSDIIMALDDVVSSVADNEDRFTEATYRTLRWLDRCYKAHARPTDQALFPIVQGGLDIELGGLREQCLAGFRVRDDHIPGYAIGGLAGGESKGDFWKVVDRCCGALPDGKPRYLMGVGYPLDLVVCTALGVDMYDCVYPTRTARFGVALVSGEAPGTLRLKSFDCASDGRVVEDGCACQACGVGKYSRARLHQLLKSNNPLAAQLLTHHNLSYMMNLTRRMREAIIEDRYGEFVRDFVADQFRGKENGGQDVPAWVRDALASAGIELESS